MYNINFVRGTHPDLHEIVRYDIFLPILYESIEKSLFI